MRKLWKSVRQGGETALVVFGLATIPWLPRRAILGLARVAGGVGRRLAPELRRLAEANLTIAFGAELPEAERQRILRETYRMASLVMLDLFWFARFRDRRLRRWVIPEESTFHYRNAKPAIVVTGHMGNWEIMGQSARMMNAPIVTVAMPLKNPAVDVFLGHLRREAGQQVETRSGAVRGLLKALRAQRHIALIMDQNTLPREGGLFVDFFGLPAPVSKAAATLGRHTGAPIVVAVSRACPDGTYRIICEPGFHVGAMTDEEVTRRIVERFEVRIRECPGQWLWMYKRWKFVPPGAARERYPFYAKPVPGQG